MVATVLIVDDFEPFRHYLRWALQGNPGFHIVGEAADGMTAVEKAEELKPDIILIDIAMPSLNGLEAARQIRGVSPSSKIVFVTEHESTFIVRYALELGARGYLIKSHSAAELLTAMEAVFLGSVYVSKYLQLDDITGHNAG
jgi:DNA-binding NarL/FixJ family response regulator